MNVNSNMWRGFLLAGAVLVLSACDDAGTKPLKGSTSVLGGKASIVLPEGYVKMPQKMLETKFPQGNRPQEAWYLKSEDGKVTIAFKSTDQAVRESQISQMSEGMKQQLRMFNPVVTDVTVNGRKMSRMEMITPSLDGEIFNVAQISSMDNKMLISSFSVPKNLKETYEKGGKDALSTLTY